MRRWPIAIALGLATLVVIPTAARAANGPFGVSLDADAGARWLGLETFEANRGTLTAGVVPTSALGPTVGVGVGMRLLVFTFGLRTSASFFDPNVQSNLNGYQLWNLDADFGVKMPLPVVEPYVLLGGGYSTLGGLDAVVQGVTRGLDIDGANLHAGLGMNATLAKSVVLGLRLDGHLLFLRRQGVPLRDIGTVEQPDGTFNDPQDRMLAADGSSIGGALGFLAELGYRL